MQKLFPADPIKKLDDDLWIITGRLGFPLLRNMVIWRMPDGGLLLHSLVGLDEAGFAELEKLGKPAIAIVPHKAHQMDAPLYRQRYPGLKMLTPANGRADIRPEAGIDGTVEETLPQLGIGLHEVPGVKVPEFTYEIPLSAGGRALIVCDAFTNAHAYDHTKGTSGIARAILGGTGEKLGIARIYRWFIVRQEADLRAYGRRLADLPDVRIMTVSHGEPVIGDVGAALKAAFG